MRRWIAEKHRVPEEHVLVTNGSMQASTFLFDELVEPGDVVIAERPTYDRTLLSLRNRGVNLHAVSMQVDGIDVEQVAGLLDEHHLRPKLAHIIPNFQNPAGYTLSWPKRECLVALARLFKVEGEATPRR